MYIIRKNHNNGNRPDTAVFNCGAACNCDLDIAMAHPWSADVFPLSGVTEGIAAKRRVDRKEAKYNRCVVQQEICLM